MNKVIEQHTAGPQAIGFDYQFYYFMYLSLQLSKGQKIGFEVKDDVHIDTPEGQILYQIKHSIQKNKDGETQNLTLMDIDLWKTLSNWADMINSEKSNTDYIKQTEFLLITNKNENNNSFISKLSDYKEGGDHFDTLYDVLDKTKNTTENDTIKGYIKNFLTLGKRKLKQFFYKLNIETGVDNIIAKIKEQIYFTVKQKRFIDPIYDKLYANLQADKYLEISNRNKFEISFDDFTKKYGKCFQVAFEEKPLPKRNFPIVLPDNIENQTFIKQLIEIGDVDGDSSNIEEYTSYKLNVINHLSYWADEHFVLPTDLLDFERESILKWKNEYTTRYRTISQRIKNGEKIEDLENEIQALACDLIAFLRRENLTLDGRQLGIEFSNGYFYSLSDLPKIGWHLNWEEKYNRK